MKYITSALSYPYFRYPNKAYSFMGTCTSNLAARYHGILGGNVKRKRAIAHPLGTGHYLSPGGGRSI